MAKKFLKLNLEPTESQIEVAVDSYASEVGVLIDGSAATSEEIKTDIQNLTDAANAKTGNNDTNLTDAVTSLVDGYGEEYEGVVTVVDGDPDLIAPINAYAAELGVLVGGGSSTPEGVKTDIQSLTAAANEKTEEADNTLAEAVETLIDHYGVAISGSLDITENGTFNVADKVSVNVTVPVPDGYIMPSGTMAITENGTHDVTNYESVNVTVEGEQIPDYSESDFVLAYMNVDGGLSIGYNSTVKTAFEAAPDGAEIEIFNDPNFYPENIKNGVSIFGVEGTYDGGNQGGKIEFNIAYGDTAPTDTSKLWIKANEPEAIHITSAPVFADEELEMGVATLPTGTTGIASMVRTKIYFFGGYNSGYLNTINVFDTESNTITTLSTTLPTAASGMASAAIGTKVYLFGGYGGSYLNTINVFDTESNSITTLSTKLPAAANGIASAVVGTKIYLFGGSYYGGPGSGTICLNTINVFDTETSTITTLSAKLPKNLYSIAAAVVGMKVYLFGGIGASNGAYTDTINVFDTENNTITTLNETLPAKAYSIAPAVIGTKIYLFGGSGSSSLNTINIFDTESNIITTLDTKLPTGASGISTAVVGTKIYLCYAGNINVFTVLLPLNANNILIEASINKNLFNLLANLELGINAVYLGNADGVGEVVAAALYKDEAWVEI